MLKRVWRKENTFTLLGAECKLGQPPWEVWRCLKKVKIEQPYIYIYMNTTQPSRKNESLPIATTWMDLEGIALSEISQTEKDKYCACEA